MKKIKTKFKLIGSGLLLLSLAAFIDSGLITALCVMGSGLIIIGVALAMSDAAEW